MRRLTLPPPSPVAALPFSGEGALAGDDARPHPRLARAPFPDPSLAHPTPRRFFDPVEGWVRKLERSVSLTLSRKLFPRIPGAALPYDLQVRHGLTVSETEIPIHGLPPALDDLRVLLITDLHAGPFLSPRALRAALDRLLDLAPDVILLGGDLVTCRLEDLSGHLPALRSLRAPLSTFAVLGNHDHYTGLPERLRDRIEGCGVRVLHNEVAYLARGQARLALAGIDDLVKGTPDLDGALAGVGNPTQAPVILLSHNPDVFPEAARRGVSLVLSGHTHGGQVRVPGLPVLVRMSRFRLDEGRYRLGGSELVVSRGLGVSGLPLRVACPPEACLLTLRCAAEVGDVPPPTGR